MGNKRKGGKEERRGHDIANKTDCSLNKIFRLVRTMLRHFRLFFFFFFFARGKKNNIKYIIEN